VLGREGRERFERVGLEVERDQVGQIEQKRGRQRADMVVAQFQVCERRRQTRLESKAVQIVDRQIELSQIGQEVGQRPRADLLEFVSLFFHS